MINACLFRKDSRLSGFELSGHADSGEYGQDIVCAAISALTCNLINSLEELTDNRIRADTDSGKTIIEWEHLDERGQLLVD
ncbi:MAG: ribosomal-processing cysteine protease Prp, partial [Ligilactobacillus ruminis]|nr:ribosomal-processing cysteine protease Prp [Ligilactobacillus ruminis]